MTGDSGKADSDAGASARGPVEAPDAMSAHLAFQREIADLLADADITEEQRQQFLIAATCPCCGAGGLSLSLSLKPGAAVGF